MRFAPVLALTAVSVCAVPLANIAVASAATDVLRRDEASIGSTIDALAEASREVNIDPKAVLATVEAEDSSIVTDILNNQIGTVRKRQANIKAVAEALFNALTAAGVNVEVALANINIDQNTLLRKLGNDSDDVVDADILAVLTALVEAALDANINVILTASKANLDVVSICSNILNHNTTTVFPIFGRSDTSDLDVYSTVLALVQAFSAVGIPVDNDALNAFIQKTEISPDILNANIIKILGI